MTVSNAFTVAILIGAIAFLPGCVTPKKYKQGISEAYKEGNSVNDKNFLKILKEMDKEQKKTVKERNEFKHRIDKFLSIKCDCTHKGILEGKEIESRK